MIASKNRSLAGQLIAVLCLAGATAFAVWAVLGNWFPTTTLATAGVICFLYVLQ